MARKAAEEANWSMQVVRDALPKMASTSVPSVPRLVIDNATDGGGGFAVAPDPDHDNHWWVHLPGGDRAGPYWSRRDALEVARQRQQEAEGK